MVDNIARCPRGIVDRPCAGHDDASRLEPAQRPEQHLRREGLFTSFGEHLKVYDRAADGQSAVVLYGLSDGTGPYFSWNLNESDSVVDIDLELPEGDWIFFKARLGEYGNKTIVSGTCGAGVTDYA